MKIFGFAEVIMNKVASYFTHDLIINCVYALLEYKRVD